MARLAALCVLAAVGCLLNSMAFVPAPESQARAINTGAVAAAAGVMAAGAPQNAEAFVFKGGFAVSIQEGKYHKHCTSNRLGTHEMKPQVCIFSRH